MCGLVFERNPGDTWAFTIIGDRLPVAAIIVVLYFGFGRSHRVLGLTTFVVMGVLLVLTAPNRWGGASRCTICPVCSRPIPRIRFLNSAFRRA